MSADACPCGSGRALPACCGALHDGERAGSAEQLMRSRYSAFVLSLTDYLLETWHSSTRPPTLELDPETTWLGLSIKSTRTVSATQAEVEFVARSRVGGGSAMRHHERSRFVFEADRWWYLDGAQIG